MPLKTIINLVLGVLLISLVFFGYRAFTSGSGDTATARLAPEGFATSGGNSTVRNQFVDTLRAIKEIHFQTSVFANPVFQSLRDWHVELISKPVGRLNPFAPVGAGGEVSLPPLATTTSRAQPQR